MATIDPSATGITEERQDYAAVTLTFQAYPYGRSTDPQVIQLTAGTSPVPSILIDGFDTAPVGTGWATTTTPRTQGARSAYTLAH